jgi:hypothetical protein
MTATQAISRLLPAAPATPEASRFSLDVIHDGQVVRSSSGAALTLGRDPACDILVPEIGDCGCIFRRAFLFLQDRSLS